MFLRKAAIRPVPRYAVIDEAVIGSLESLLDEPGEQLQKALDDGFRVLDRTQPALARYLADIVSDGGDEFVQSLGYFLTVTVYLAFRDAFPTRLAEIDERSLNLAREMLETDTALRAADPHEVLESDDVIALTQPHLVGFVQHHLEEALRQADEEVTMPELERTYQAVLVEVIALSAAVRAPDGHLDSWTSSYS